MAKIYVGNLTYEFEPRDLEAEFARFGAVEQCAVKRGFAFIHFQDQQAAEAAVQEMDNYEWRGRRMRVAFATSTGESDRRARGNDGGGGGGGGRGGDSRSEGQVSQNLFVANIPPHIKMRELEEFFEQFGKVENVKILPQARGNQAMSAFVDFSEVVEAQKAHESELVLDGHRLRSDYNIRRGGERRRDDYDRGSDRRQNDYDRHGSFDDNRRAYSSRGQRSDRYDDYDNRRGNNYSNGNGRRDRSRSPARQSDRRDDRRGGYGDDDRCASRRDRSPPRGGGRGDRDFGRNDDQQQRRSREPRSPPRNSGPNDYKSGSAVNGSPRRDERNLSPAPRSTSRGRE